VPATVGVSLGDLRWLDVRSLPPETLLVVPLGASEQHGPHLPLSTASDIVDALARTVAERRDDVVVAPLVAYGSSGEHGGFAGTLSVGHEAIELFLLALARAASATFSRLLFVCAHGGNAEPLRRVVHRLRPRGGTSSPSCRGGDSTRTRGAPRLR
jgi:creatinine amidohydrolase